MTREAVESPGFDLTVDRDAELPIGVQVRERVVALEHARLARSRARPAPAGA